MSNAAIVIVTNGGKVLLLKRSLDSTNGGTWGFPGGKYEVEDGDLHNTGARELWEETGYGTEVPLLFVEDDGNVVTYRLPVDLFTPTLNSEHTAFMWADPEALPQPLHPGTQERIHKVMASKRITDMNGWYEVQGNPISKVGVFPYSGRIVGAEEPNKLYNVYRPEEELNNPETIRSFQLLPFINDHPEDMLGLDEDLPKVDGKPVEGIIGEKVFYKDGYLYGNLKIFTDRIAKAIDAGKREVSAGFRCVYEKVSGVYNGQPYDYIQRNIRGNHVALVNEGRMGPEVAVLDHLKLTFDAKELIKMAETTATPAKDEGGPEMTLAEITATIKAIGPQIAALTEAMAALAPGAATVAEPAADAEVTPPAATTEPAATDVKPTGLDALEKSVKALQAENVALKAAQGKALDAKQVFAAGAERDALYRGVSAIVGAFDHAAMDTTDVAKYAVEKFGLKGIQAGHEITAVSAYLAAKPGKVATKALDAKSTATPSAIRQHVTAPAVTH